MLKDFYSVEKLFVTLKTLSWCQSPYIGHKKGCPNRSLEKCFAAGFIFIDEIINTHKRMVLVVSEFDLASHAEKMRRKHPNWSERQCRNLLYWQGHARKIAREKFKYFQNMLGFYTFVERPERYGVNLYATCAVSGFYLEPIRNLKTVRFVALLGEKPEGKS